MAHDFIQSAGSAPAVSAIDVTFLYDPRDGRVFHVHHVITLEGAQRRNPAEQQRRAEESALRLGVPVENLEVLHVADFRRTGKMYRVDPKTRTLAETPMTARKSIAPHRGRRSQDSSL